MTNIFGKPPETVGRKAIGTKAEEKETLRHVSRLLILSANRWKRRDAKLWGLMPDPGEGKEQTG